MATNPQDASLTLKIERARWWALANQSFYGSLCMGLTDVLGNPAGDTACTDGRRIYWDRAFLAKLTDEETRFVLLHETMHPAHGHLWRLPADERGNMAGDYAINATLSKIKNPDGSSPVKMPEGGLLNPAFDSLAEEEILNRIPEPPKGGKQGGQGSGSSCGDFCKPADDGQGDGKPGKGDSGQNPAKGGSKTPPDGQKPGNQPQNDRGEALEDQWKERVIQAAQAAKALGQGNCPADLQRVIDRTLNQKIDWRREMADFVKERVSTRNDWSRSARRHAWQPVIYPRKRQDETGLLICVRDTSGSIGDAMIAEFNGLIESCMGESNCRAIVMDCDAAIHAEHTVEPGEPVPREAKGGGGTSFVPPFERAAEMIESGEKIAGLIYLTDMMGDFPESPDFATLWLATTDAQGPFGRTVRVEA